MTAASGADISSKFDFRKPCALAVEVEQRLRAWQESTTRRTNQRWEQLLPIPLVWTPDRVQPQHAATLAYESPVVAFEMDVNQTPGGVALVLPRSFALTVVHDLLEQEVTELAEDKVLTALEETMLRYVCESFAEGCNETQPVTPSCQLSAFHAKPDLERMFQDAGDVVVIRFALEGPFGRQLIDWIWQEELITALFSSPTAMEPSAESAAHLEHTAREIPFELVVRLGSTPMRISQLSSLSPGDVIQLDQRIAEPLVAFIRSRPCFSGWAGRIGKSQAFQVAGVLSPSAGSY